jgi:hypothetical protein
MAQIQEKLGAGPVAVVGLGGIGKSAIALEFAHRGYKTGRFAIAWWIRAESRVTLVEDLAGLAPALGVAARTDQGQTVERVQAALQARRDWLLVFDNAGEPDDVRPWLVAGAGSTLITSRVGGWGTVAVEVGPEGFSREESLSYLRARVRRYEAAAADQLARLLGDLPLALAQAAGHMTVCDQSVGGYLAVYRDRSAAGKLLARRIDGYPASVATTWLVNVRQLARDEPASLELLCLCSFLDPDSIDLALILSARDLLPPHLGAAASHPLSLEDAVGALARTGLATPIEDQRVRLHRLVAQVTRLDLGAGGTRDGGDAGAWARRATAVVNHLFPQLPQNPATWQRCAGLTAHVGQLSDLEAARVLERYAGGQFSLAGLSAADHSRLLRLGGGLPLSLMVLGRFLNRGLAEGRRLPQLLRELDTAEALVREAGLGVRLRAGGEQPGSSLVARWTGLSPEQKWALQAAAVFREKPSSFEEGAWACVLAARRAPSGEAEEPEELARRLGASLGRAANNPDFRDETEGVADISAMDADGDEDLEQVIEAVEALKPLRRRSCCTRGPSTGWQPSPSTARRHGCGSPQPSPLSKCVASSRKFLPLRAAAGARSDHVPVPRPPPQQGRPAAAEP